MTQEQKDTLRYLADTYGLKEDHFFISKHFVIVNKIGIEKIAEREKIAFGVEVIETNSTYAAVKVTSFCPTVTKDTHEKKRESVQFASASSLNSNNNYYLEMAIKRAKAKCVLDLVGAYSKGIYSEQEADEFTQDEKK